MEVCPDRLSRRLVVKTRTEAARTKVWLITCNCRALMQALADAVLASGHNLVATAVDTEPLKELVERYGDQLRIVPMEVTDGPAADSAIQATLDAFGRLDVLVLDLAKWRSGLTIERLQHGESALPIGALTSCSSLAT
jgi:NAD(P)-dependent dehydrogenase (short-subunit alcohol dehydrogenase family)